MRKFGSGLIDKVFFWSVTILVSFLALAVLTHCRLDKTAVPIQRVAFADLRAIDGDTVSWQGERVRLVGFDTPEIFLPDCAAELGKGQAAGWHHSTDLIIPLPTLACRRCHLTVRN